MTDERLPNDRDDLHDRLIDRALEERLGGAAAPDLSERILAATRGTEAAAITPAALAAGGQGERSRVRWASLAIAVCLMVAAAAGLLLPAMQAAREAAGRPEPPASGQRFERVVVREPEPRVLTEREVIVETAKRRASESGASPDEASAEQLSLGVPVNSDAVEGAEVESRYASSTTTPPVPAGLQIRDAPALQPASGPTELTDKVFDIGNGTGVGGFAVRGEAAVVPSAQAPPADEEAPADPMYQLGETLAFDNRPGLTAQGGRGGRGGGYGGGGGGLRGYSGRGRGPERDWYFSRAPQESSESLDDSDSFSLGFDRDGATSQSGAGDAADLEVMRQMATMAASSGSALEVAVAAELDKDPTIAMYKEQLFALSQQIEQLLSESKDRDNPQLTLLEGQYAQTEEAMERYRVSALGEVRARIAKMQDERIARLIGDRYAEIIDNPFRSISAATTDNRLSTFSIDVDTASYANVRQFLMQGNMLPPADAVRIEELVNYFDYDYKAPTDDTPFAANVEVAACPWAPKHRLVRVGIKGREVERSQRPKSNLVFLVDVSGSMDEPQKLPLLVEGMRMLTRELGENDRVAIVVYASTEGLALDSTRGDQQETILGALDRLSAGGSTAGGAGIQLAYKVAAQNFVEGGVNRVILCTDGDFNVGVTDVEALQQLAADKAKDSGVFLTVLGFGRGNLNDALMEAVADHGNGNYHYVDNRGEARKVLVEEMTGTLVTIAKDVKIQIEFNPAKVAGYRLIGYENRVLAAQDFNDDTKDAGEIGAGHTVTALYEIVPAGETVGAPATDELKYGGPIPPSAGGGDGAAAGAGGGDAPARYAGVDGEASDEMLTLKIRYKRPDGDESTKLEFPVTDGGEPFAKASGDFQFASAVAGFGMLLRGSPHRGDATFAGVLEIAESAVGDRDPHGYRREFIEMVAQAKRLAGE